MVFRIYLATILKINSKMFFFLKNILTLTVVCGIVIGRRKMLV